MHKKRVESGAEYLNVDLEIRSRSDLTPLVEALSRSLFLLHAGRIPRTFLASFETPGMALPPDRAIKRVTEAVSALPPSARKFWKEARDRVFDIGIAKSAGPDVFALALRPETLIAIAQLDARLAFTLYPAEKRTRQRLPNKAMETDAKRTRGSSPRRSACGTTRCSSK